MNFLPALTQWGMGLYFLLAGASTSFALERKSWKEFVKERIDRLFLPFVWGLILLFPLQAYVTMLSNTSYQGSLFTFYPFFLSEIFLRHKFYLILLYIHHLWFLLYLFGFSLVALPLCIWLRSAAGQKWLTRLERCPRNLLTLVLPLLLIRLSLLPLFPQYCSFADAACWLLIYIYGYILFSRAAIEQVIHQQARRMLRLTLIQSVIMLILWCSGFLQADLLIVPKNMDKCSMPIFSSLTYVRWSL